MLQTQVQAVLFEGNRDPEKKLVIAGQWRKCRKDSASLTVWRLLDAVMCVCVFPSNSH